MKKTKKSNIKKVVAAPAPVCVCSRAHRAWSLVALLGLFLCGLMIGLPIGAKHAPVKTVETVTETVVAKEVPVCARVEHVLSEKLYSENSKDIVAFLRNANIYATLSEYGCPENAEKYREHALADLVIADALSDNTLAQHQEVAESVIDTYKKLDMKKQANEFLDKVQKLTDPAIDFILQMEKIINE